jgi:hypothetical protein
MAQAAPDEIVEHRPMDGSMTKPDFIFRFLSLSHSTARNPG